LIILVFLMMGKGISGQPDYPFSTWNPANSGNYSVADREKDYDIRWIVIHVAEGSFKGTISWFKNPSARASAHFVISMDGKNLVHMVRLKDIAWHAGNWEYNKHSIGIEIEGYVNKTIWPDTLYENLARLIKYLSQKYNISIKHISGIAPPNPFSDSGIIGHIQVPDPNNPSLGGGRSHHKDPGALFDWNKLMKYIEKVSLTPNNKYLSRLELRLAGKENSNTYLFEVKAFDKNNNLLPFTLYEIYINDRKICIQGTGPDGVNYFYHRFDEGKYLIKVSADSVESNIIEINVKSNKTFTFILLSFLALLILLILIKYFREIRS